VSLEPGGISFAEDKDGDDGRLLDALVTGLAPRGPTRAASVSGQGAVWSTSTF
jgi:hypothetical protein